MEPFSSSLGFCRNWRLHGCWLMLGMVTSSYGYDNFCIERHYPEARTSTYCQGMTLPAEMTRNFLYERLICDAGKHQYTRSPFIFNEEYWRDVLTHEDGEARELLRAQPVPEWAGKVDYKTHLEWHWQDCRLVTDFRCGSDTVCEDQTNDDGNLVERCHEEPKTCFLDVEVSATRFCSHEQLTFDAAYQKTQNEDYPARLANGYDLLPGETEIVTVTNGPGFFDSTQMSPSLSVAEPRNQYVITRRGGFDYDTGDLQCRQHSDYHIGFDIYPEHRIQSRSGNAFSLPRDIDGEPLEALIWKNYRGSDGTSQKKAYPTALRVQDYGATSLMEFARDAGELFKNMVVRIELFDQSRWFWPFPEATAYIKEGQGIVRSLNALSEKQEIRRSNLWELLLASESLSPSKNIYRTHIPWFLYYPARLFVPEYTLSYENHLKPATNYRLRLTVYQRGLSIYNQSCEDDPDAWDCRFYFGGGWLSPSRYESGYYSNEGLEVEFTTPDDLNVRSWWPTVWSTVGLADDFALLGVIAVSVLKLAASVP